MRDSAVLDFTADSGFRNSQDFLPENLIDFSGDKFVNVIGIFGSNAAGKSNMIKAIDWCRDLILKSHLYNEGDELNYQPFKFDSGKPSSFYIDFVADGIEYEYSFELYAGRIISEELYYYPHKRRSRVFSRTATDSYVFKKGVIQRPAEVQANVGPKTLFLSRASSMGREIAQIVYRFFLNQMVIGLDSVDLSKLSAADFDTHKSILLKGLEVSDIDIVDIRLVEVQPGQYSLQSFHRENPEIAFDFLKEESEGTKRLMLMLMLLLRKVMDGATFFLDEFDLKLHFRLSEFVLKLVKASGKAQMVFTSHNPLLIDKDSLRPEQIVFVTKQVDGNSEFVPVSDYEGVGSKTDLRKAYLQGRFDAVPYVGDARDVLADL
ncbi:MAG: ATP-binding protein [Bacteroidales bacterium]|nr:ATP-binding protein [Bacteroidales bacterium]